MQDFYKQNPNYKTAIDQLRTAQRFPFSPALFEIQRESHPAQPRGRRARHQDDPPRSCEAAEAKANEILGKY